MGRPPEAFVSLDAAIASFQEILEYRFRNPALLVQALGTWNLPLSPDAAAALQRLEFLGDAAWDFAVAAAAFQARPHATAGDLTRLRAAWCSTTGLADLARQIGLPAPAGPSAPARTGRVLAEMFEAVLGAVVEDGGLDAIRTLAQRVIAQEGIVATSPLVDPKSALQMLAQARFGSLPVYRLLERRGPPHHPTFRVAVKVSGREDEIRAEAEGTSRQAAEQEAARLALEQLNRVSGP
jgi:ribonuclease-3